MITLFKSASFALLLLLQFQYVVACISNDDCKQDETCLKREKNAYGVCIKYTEKRNNHRDTSEQPKILEVEGEQQIIDFFGTPEENLRSISPNGKIGRKCHSTEDCDGTEECVIAGFEGRCLQLR